MYKVATETLAVDVDTVVKMFRRRSIHDLASEFNVSVSSSNRWNLSLPTALVDFPKNGMLVSTPWVTFLNNCVCRNFKYTLLFKFNSVLCFRYSCSTYWNRRKGFIWTCQIKTKEKKVVDDKRTRLISPIFRWGLIFSFILLAERHAMSFVMYVLQFKIAMLEK